MRETVDDVIETVERVESSEVKESQFKDRSVYFVVHDESDIGELFKCVRELGVRTHDVRRDSPNNGAISGWLVL